MFLSFSVFYIQVYMVDYGFTVQVSVKSLRCLTREHLRIDTIGFKCHLADIMPAGDVTKWSRTACEFMLDEMKDKKLFVKKRVGSLVGLD